MKTHSLTLAATLLASMVPFTATPAAAGPGSDQLEENRCIRSTTVLWAGKVLASPGGGQPELTLGPPDGQVETLTSDIGVLLGDFSGKSYFGLSSLLSARVIAGRRVNPRAFNEIDVIAFESNGLSPAPSGGWESSNWVFSDGVISVPIHWDERVGAPVDHHVIASGSVSGTDYSNFFKISPAVPDSYISYIVFRLPELDTVSSAFTIEVRGARPVVGVEGTPEPDAIGILPCRSSCR